jgi:hypothetical protein
MGAKEAVRTHLENGIGAARSQQHLCSKLGKPMRLIASLLFRWRAELGFGKSKAANLVAVRIAGNGKSDACVEVTVLQDIPPIPGGAVVVDRHPVNRLDELPAAAVPPAKHAD